ncbi:hypothetical protein FAM18172_01057 [Lacticaseibacillus paracasei]|uniref:Uncharacterized protein n=1 Tax=Lacticaseibacillus paracasei TaxID=1597 RepID=A0A422MCC3_LACPA|nr:hypothetical protein FAM18172_01057 [Lacticaseibacillus paracasei]
MGSVVTLFLNGWASRFRTRPDFETAHFAGSKLCPPRSSPIAADPARTTGEDSRQIGRETLYI